jgi:hypothetical protein
VTSGYGLAPDSDERLTSWMRERLTLAVWRGPTGIRLADVERALLVHWQPPLNLTHVKTPWTGQLSAARRRMADEARAWARDRGFEV